MSIIGDHLTENNEGLYAQHVGERIVSAACMLTNGQVVMCVRHNDRAMREIMSEIANFQRVMEQGFVTNRGRFVSRKLGWTIAEAAGQIIRRCGGDSTDGGTLYSENLY